MAYIVHSNEQVIARTWAAQSLHSALKPNSVAFHLPPVYLKLYHNEFKSPPPGSADQSERIFESGILNSSHTSTSTRWKKKRIQTENRSIYQFTHFNKPYCLDAND
ncbi:hypothetical protein ACMFMG_005007 [Clarireedia jacksonii]